MEQSCRVLQLHVPVSRISGNGVAQMAVEGWPAVPCAVIAQLRESGSKSQKPERKYSILEAARTCFKGFFKVSNTQARWFYSFFFICHDPKT